MVDKKEDEHRRNNSLDIRLKKQGKSMQFLKHAVKVASQKLRPFGHRAVELMDFGPVKKDI